MNFFLQNESILFPEEIVDTFSLLEQIGKHFLISSHKAVLMFEEFCGYALIFQNSCNGFSCQYLTFSSIFNWSR